MKKITIEIEDMNCASCAQTIEHRLSENEEVKKATVNYAIDKAIIKHTDNITVEELRKEIERVGYTPVTKEDTSKDKIGEKRRKALLSWGATLPVLVLMVLEWTGTGQIEPVPLLTTLFSLPVVLYFGWDTHRSAVKGIVNNKTFNMDSLISLGTLAALSTGGLTYITPISNYAGLAAMIMASHNVGKYLEEKAKGKASAAVKDLLELQPKQATRKREGEEEVVSIDEIRVGDLVVVRPGESIPVDGKILSGETTVNEGMVTGESKPVSKQKGDKVIGSTLNNNGYIEVEVTQVGEDTFFSKVVRLVENAQSDKLPIQELADRTTHYFVPTIILIALTTFTTWYFFADPLSVLIEPFVSILPWSIPTGDPVNLALFATLSVLVIACPCALGLATPTAIMAGTGKAAKEGLLFSNGEAMQTLTKVDTVIFDKTGTLTEGKPVVTSTNSVEGWSEEEVILHAASLEKKSEHPLGQAIREQAKDMSLLPVQSFESVTGKGLRGIVDGKQVSVGNKGLHKDTVIQEELRTKKYELESQGQTVVYVSVDDEVIGIIGMTDAVKEEAENVVRWLHGQGIETMMLTGDTEKTAKSIAEQVGIDTVKAEVLPQHKIEAVKRVQREGSIVCMVGDGINDAPALKQSNVSIAMGTGTDIAIEASDINITNGRIGGVQKVFETSHRTFSVIKQNLLWASVYNVLAVPVAAMALLHPLIAVIAMFVSSISVILNSARLQ